ncbi:MAG: TPM domain-containing protein [Myxococcota bacterium]
MPRLEARVTDLADVLAPDAEARLASQLAALEQETSHQLAVLTVPSLEGEPIEEFALRVAEGWGLGRAGFDKGVLLVVAIAERRIRIEVGYGLEGAIPDVTAKRIISDGIRPLFRRGDMAGGITAGVNALDAAARGEVLPLPERGRPRRGGLPLEELAFAVFFGGIWARILSGGKRVGGALVGAGIAAGMATLWAGFGWWVGVAAVLAFLFGMWWPGHPGSLGSHGRGGAWGGGFGGGGFGGGGFSGGGGGFGGGGASGGW